MPAATKETPDSLGTGRRKTSVARVRIRAGSGKIMINERPLEDFFNNEQHRFAVLSPLKKVNGAASLDVSIRVHGGGITGQAGACMLGIARALKLHDPEFEPLLRDGTYLTRDSRMKERKKYGLHGARRGTQFSKR
jgi:small subunit ribosomal protein S9